MALIERIMRWGSHAGETVPNPEPTVRYIPVHQFFAAQAEVIANQITVPQIKAFYNMNAEDIADYDALVALAPTTAAAQALYIERIHAVFLLAEGRVTGYSTPAEVRTKLGI